jgi:hypothetical protein
LDVVCSVLNTFEIRTQQNQTAAYSFLSWSLGLLLPGSRLRLLNCAAAYVSYMTQRKAEMPGAVAGLLHFTSSTLRLRSAGLVQATGTESSHSRQFR